MGGELKLCEIEEIARPVAKTNFVECGTYLGHTTLTASGIFEKVHTIEIMEPLYLLAQEMCKDRTNIEFHLGDTCKILPELVQGLEGDTVFFLDSHQSGQDTGNNGKWVPLLDELEIILSNLKNLDHKYIFIIDDVRLWSNAWDWADISTDTVLEVFRRNGFNPMNSYEANDRFVIRII